ncbi:MAG: allophanate hydrolase [Bryobacteraceae bacterium]
MPLTIDLSISNLRMLYQSGALTPEKLLNAIYDRIESAPLHPVWITAVPRAEALARAKALSSASSQLPLYGIPFAVKDNIDVAGLPTTAGCPAYAYTPGQTSFVVQKLQSAGALLIGKTNMDQFATGLVGTRSPYGACSSVFDAHYISGGSSSGSAVSVASGLVTFALGTDTAGSGRVPAAFNNIVGLKPSRGVLSVSGVVPACRSLDCVSIFALSCADASTVFDTTRAVDPADPFSRAWSPLPVSTRPRLGVPRQNQLEFFGNKEYERLYKETISFLANGGCTAVEIDFTPFQKTAELLYEGPYIAERFVAVGEFIKAHRDGVDPVVESIILASERFTATQAYEAQYRLKALAQQTAKIWNDIDILLLPTAPTTYTIEEVRCDPVKLNSNLGYYTNFLNLLDLCGVAVPAGLAASGLPFGVTAIGPAFSEHSLLAFADHIQHVRVPFSGNNVAKTPEAVLTYSPTISGWVALGVVGAHLSGQPLNYQLRDRGAKLLRTTKTARDYQCFALTNTSPAKPGLIRVPGFAGPGIEIEIWLVPEWQFGSFVAAVPPPLSIGTCELADGERIKGFLCEPYATAGMPEITQLGSWRQYLKTLR